MCIGKAYSFRLDSQVPYRRPEGRSWKTVKNVSKILNNFRINDLTSKKIYVEKLIEELKG
jgi:hypothetical protein